MVSVSSRQWSTEPTFPRRQLRDGISVNRNFGNTDASAAYNDAHDTRRRSVRERRGVLVPLARRRSEPVASLRHRRNRVAQNSPDDSATRGPRINPPIATDKVLHPKRNTTAAVGVLGPSPPKRYPHPSLAHGIQYSHSPTRLTCATSRHEMPSTPLLASPSSSLPSCKDIEQLTPATR